ncbi:hypothetical protein, partial [Paenibacillus sp. AR247]|uniref:hypothetical protein n=1 Tax=Paenibacillus sp. AR247 TaxID=1631599 RepID=UPI001C614F34
VDRRYITLPDRLSPPPLHPLLLPLLSIHAHLISAIPVRKVHRSNAPSIRPQKRYIHSTKNGGEEKQASPGRPNYGERATTKGPLLFA